MKEAEEHREQDIKDKEAEKEEIMKAFQDYTIDFEKQCPWPGSRPRAQLRARR